MSVSKLRSALQQEQQHLDQQSTCARRWSATPHQPFVTSSKKVRRGACACFVRGKWEQRDGKFGDSGAYLCVKRGVHFAPELTGAAPRKCLNTTCYSGGTEAWTRLLSCTCSVTDIQRHQQLLSSSFHQLYTPPTPPPASFFPSLSSRLLPSLTSAHLRNPETPRVHGASCPSTISTFILNIYIHPVLFMCRAEAQWGRCVQAFPAVSGNPRLTWREDSCLERWGGSGSCSAALKWIEGSLKLHKKEKKNMYHSQFIWCYNTQHSATNLYCD